MPHARPTNGVPGVCATQATRKSRYVHPQSSNVRAPASLISSCCSRHKRSGGTSLLRRSGRLLLRFGLGRLSTRPFEGSFLAPKIGFSPFALGAHSMLLSHGALL